VQGSVYGSSAAPASVPSTQPNGQPQQQSQPQTQAPTSTPAATTQPSAPKTTTQTYLEDPNTLNPPSAGHANIVFYSDKNCASKQETLTNVVADGSSCIPTNNVGHITVLCGSNGYQIYTFQTPDCSGAVDETLTGSTGTASTCATAGQVFSQFKTQSQIVQCGVVGNTVSGSPLQQASTATTVTQPTQIQKAPTQPPVPASASTSANPNSVSFQAAPGAALKGKSSPDQQPSNSASVAASNSTNSTSNTTLPPLVQNAVILSQTTYNASAELQDGIAYRPTLTHNISNNAYTFDFGYNRTGSAADADTALQYVIVHYTVDSNAQQNRQLSVSDAGKQGGKYSWVLESAPTDKFVYSFTVGRGYQFDTTQKTINATQFFAKAALPGNVAYLS
jgi:hypothetical protein